MRTSLREAALPARDRAGAARRSSRALLLLVLVALPLAAQASALERFRAYVRDMHSASARFEQKVYDHDRNLVQHSRGRFAFERPGRFRWVYEAPEPQLIVGDGTRVWIYDEDLKQVTVRRLAKALGSTPAALLSGSADVERAFAFKEGGREGGLEWLIATPREPESGFERILLGMGAAGVEAMQLVDHFGQTTELRFSGIERNPKLDPGLFRFTPPPDADVLGEP